MSRFLLAVRGVLEGAIAARPSPVAAESSQLPQFARRTSDLDVPVRLLGPANAHPALCIVVSVLPVLLRAEQVKKAGAILENKRRQWHPQHFMC